jgi:hypothetical protein
MTTRREETVGQNQKRKDSGKIEGIEDFFLSFDMRRKGTMLKEPNKTDHRIQILKVSNPALTTHASRFSCKTFRRIIRVQKNLFFFR